MCRPFFVAAVALVLASCDSGGSLATEAGCTFRAHTRSNLTACVTGLVEERISGSPASLGWTDPALPVDLWALRTGGSPTTGGVDLYVYLENGAGTVRPGDYTVELRPRPIRANDGNTLDSEARPGLAVAVIYLSSETGRAEVWPATGGTITVEQSEANRSIGRFSLESVRDSGHIEVVGRFTYVR